MIKTIPSQLKKRQKEILLLLYRFRFLKRSQLQILLNHKQFSRIIIWLNDLTKNTYVRRYFDQKIAPDVSVYSLGTSARSYFIKHPEEKMHTKLLDRVWREQKYSLSFRNHWVLLADIYISLLSLTKETGATLKFWTQVDLHGMKYLIKPAPDTFFSITEKSGLVKRYFLDIFDSNPTRGEMYTRISQYIYYFQKQYWQDHNKTSFPIIIFVAPNDWAKGYLQRTTRKLLQQKGIEIEFYLTTWTEIQKHGFNRQTLHKIIL